MKKAFAVFFVSLMTLSITSCGSGNNDNAIILENPASTSATDTVDSSEDSRVSQSKENSVLSDESNNTQNESDSEDTTSAGAPFNADTTGSVVYMTTDISPEGLMAVYEALEWTPQGNVAVKLSTGEPPASNYLRPELIADVVAAVDGTIVECNTAYGGSRAETAMHYQVAEDHGFTAIADF